MGGNGGCAEHTGEIEPNLMVLSACECANEMWYSAPSDIQRYTNHEPACHPSLATNREALCVAEVQESFELSTASPAMAHLVYDMIVRG